MFNSDFYLNILVINPFMHGICLDLV